jgi:hypothetical protein
MRFLLHRFNSGACLGSRTGAIGHLATVTAAPITSTIRGVSSEVILDVDDEMKGVCAVTVLRLE